MSPIFSCQREILFSLSFYFPTFSPKTGNKSFRYSRKGSSPFSIFNYRAALSPTRFPEAFREGLFSAARDALPLRPTPPRSLNRKPFINRSFSRQPGHFIAGNAQRLTSASAIPFICIQDRLPHDSGAATSLTTLH